MIHYTLMLPHSDHETAKKNGPTSQIGCFFGMNCTDPQAARVLVPNHDALEHDHFLVFYVNKYIPPYGQQG
jgi:hypothetical protein